MVVFLLLAFIVVVFILQLIIGSFTGLFIFDPSLALVEPWRFITSIFLHGDPSHLFFNGFALFMFGIILERKIGRDKFLMLFFAAGIIASITYYLTIIMGIAPSIPALGASGAIYGVLGCTAVLLPNLRIFFWFFPMRMREAAILWVVLEFVGTFNPGSGIASAAHLGGLLFGFLYGFYLKQQEKKETQFYAYY